MPPNATPGSAAPYDPDHRAPGLVQESIAADMARNACAQQIAASGTAPRLEYQLGRALAAKH